MNKKFIPFIVLCIVISIIPSVGMIFFPTTTSTENTALQETPRIVNDDGSLNRLFFQDCGEYFNDHIALRNQMIFVDAKIQTKLLMPHLKQNSQAIKDKLHHIQPIL